LQKRGPTRVLTKASEPLRPAMTKIGIIGAGGIGRALAVQLARARINTVISNSTGGGSLAALAREIGPHATAGTVMDASRPEIVILALPWSAVGEAVAPIRDWDGRIVVDATNPLGAHAASLERTSSEVIADLVPGARVVKAFNTLPPAVLGANPGEAGGRRVIFFSGDHARAKGEVARLLDRLGFSGIDLGGLAEGGRLHQFPGGPLSALNLLRLG